MERRREDWERRSFNFEQSSSALLEVGGGGEEDMERRREDWERRSFNLERSSSALLEVGGGGEEDINHRRDPEEREKTPTRMRGERESGEARSSARSSSVSENAGRRDVMERDFTRFRESEREGDALTYTGVMILIVDCNSPAGELVLLVFDLFERVWIQKRAKKKLQTQSHHTNF